MESPTIAAVNALAARWASTCGGQSTAQAAVGVWPLLGFLAHDANEPGRGELTGALGLDADHAADAAREVLSVASSSAAVTLTVGLWTRDGLPIHEAWLDLLPPGSAGSLDADPAVSQEALDAWVRDQTHGLIERMPVTLAGDDLLVLASALLVRTRWIEPFETTMLNGGPHGPWQYRRLDGLYRTSTDPDQAEVSHGPAGAVTTVRVRGSEEIDVVLVLGEPDGEPGTILAQGIAVATGTHKPVAAGYSGDGPLGPGMTSEVVESTLPDPYLLLQLPTFSVSGTHDLLHDAPLFGLRTVSDRSRGHFPGISTFPLAVSSAAQNVTATFGAEGFDAAAVTAFVMGAGGRGPKLPYRVRRLAVAFDRPFGFAAVQRGSALVLACGWVEDPGRGQDTIDLDELSRESGDR